MLYCFVVIVILIGLSTGHAFTSIKLSSGMILPHGKRFSPRASSVLPSYKFTIHREPMEKIVFVAYDSIYEKKDSVAVSLLDRVRDSRIFKLVMLQQNSALFVFFASIAVFQLRKFKAFHSLFNKVRLLTNVQLTKDNLVAFGAEDGSPMECEKCALQLTPPENRRGVSALYSLNFRCPRCGAPTAAFFNINNMEDPRAVARKKRLENEEMGLDEDGNEL